MEIAAKPEYVSSLSLLANFSSDLFRRTAGIRWVVLGEALVVREKTGARDSREEGGRIVVGGERGRIPSIQSSVRVSWIWRIRLVCSPTEEPETDYRVLFLSTRNNERQTGRNERLPGRTADGC